MKNLLKRRNNTNRFGSLVVIFCIVFNMNTLIVSAHISNTIYAISSLIIILVLSYLNKIFDKRSFCFNGRSLVFFCLLMLMVLLSALINNEIHNILYWVIILELFKAMLLTNMIGFQEFSRIYVLAISFLALVSLIFFVGIKIIPSLINFSVIRTHSSGNGFVRSFGLYYILPDASTRNTGFLSEPGDFQHYLNIALILDLFFVKKSDKSIINKYSHIILSLAVVTTFSSAGLVFLALIWLAYIHNKRLTYNSMILIILAIIFAVCIVFSSPVLLEGLAYSINKLTGASTSSLSVRMTSLTSGFQTLNKNFVFGNGIDGGTEQMRMIFDARKLIYHQTSTTACFFSMFGVFFGVAATWYYFKPFVVSLKNNTKRLSIILLCVGIFLSINNERYIYGVLFYIFLFYGASVKNTDDVVNVIQYKI